MITCKRLFDPLTGTNDLTFRLPVTDCLWAQKMVFCLRFAFGIPCERSWAAEGLCCLLQRGVFSVSRGLRRAEGEARPRQTVARGSGRGKGRLQTGRSFAPGGWDEGGIRLKRIPHGLGCETLLSLLTYAALASYGEPLANVTSGGGSEFLRVR